MRKQFNIGLIPIGELMDAAARPAKIKVHQQARQQAMLAQRTTDVQAWPVGNRKARRIASSKAKEKPL